jgi:hypothetical protein
MTLGRYIRFTILVSILGSTDLQAFLGLGQLDKIRSILSHNRT